MDEEIPFSCVHRGPIDIYEKNEYGFIEVLIGTIRFLLKIEKPHKKQIFFFSKNKISK